MNANTVPLSVKKKNSGVYGVRKQRRITCTIPTIGFVLNVVTVWWQTMSERKLDDCDFCENKAVTYTPANDDVCRDCADEIISNLRGKLTDSEEEMPNE